MPSSRGAAPAASARSRVFGSSLKRPSSSKRGGTKSKYATQAWVYRVLWIWTLAAACLMAWTYRRVLRSLSLAYSQAQHAHDSAAGMTDKGESQNMESTTAINEQTRGLLEILLSAPSSDTAAVPPWPSYLTLHHPQHHSPTVMKNDDDDIHTNSCIVTAYFRVPSKYDSGKYENDWMENILLLNDCMVIFCEADLVPTMLQWRRDRPRTAVVQVRLQDLPVARYHYPHDNDDGNDNSPATTFWQHQLDMDPERKRHHSYELFWIWLSKSWCVSTAVTLQHHLFPSLQLPAATTADNNSNKKNTIDYWMWADIGSFRSKSFRNQQLIRYPEQLLGTSSKDDEDNQTVVWMAHHAPNPPGDPFWSNKLHPQQKQHFYHSGSHAVATGGAWRSFHALFVDTLDQYAAKGKFVGEDQCVLQTTCLLHPEHCAYVPFDQVPDNHYFGLRHVLHYGPAVIESAVAEEKEGVPQQQTKKGHSRLKPFRLWRPPAV